MNIEKGKISNSQLIFLIIGFIEGSAFLVYFVSNLAQHDTWITVLAGLLVVIPFGYIYALLAKRFSGFNFARINQMVYGSFLGTMISLLYLGYFFLLFAVNLKNIGNFFTTNFMTGTPAEVFAIVFTFVCAYAVWHGIEVLDRVAPFIVITVSLVIIGTALMLLPKMDFANFLPVGELSFINFIHGTQIIAEILFGELIVFLPVGFTLNDSKLPVKTFLSGLLLAAAFLAIITIRNTAVLGNTEVLVSSPSFQVIRLINFGFLSRLDILFAGAHTVVIFLKCSVLFYVTALLLAQIVGLRTYLPVIFPLGCLGIILGMIAFPSPTVNLDITANSLLVVFFPFIFIFPPLSLLIAKIRNLPQKGSSE